MIKKLCWVWLCITLVTCKARAQSTQEYIADHIEYAQSLMRLHKIPASLIIAIAIHESASGNSKIARYMNNHFGIKGPNSNTEIRSSYRDYETIEASYDHFIDFLQSRSSFQPLFDRLDQYDYRAWARGIQRGGYAHSRSWASQVIGLIKKHELFQYDERPDDYTEPALPAARSSHKPSGRSKSKKTYTVKKGDNLGRIAKRYKTTTRNLMGKNGLKSTALKPGQKIKI
jgi:hypothetical protein